MKHQTTLALIVEDDALRSAYMRTLIQEPAPQRQDSRKEGIPFTLIQFWDNSASLPADVQHCLDSWEPLTRQGFTRHIFNEPQALEFITTNYGPAYAQAFSRCPHPAMKCDYFRLCYIYQQGGFYVDADEQYLGGDCRVLLQDSRLKLQPLCYDMRTGEMIAPAAFIGQRQHADEWIYYVNNNPLIAPARHPVVGLALERATNRLLQAIGTRQAIQSTTGPGNLTASLVQHALSTASGTDQDFWLLPNWESISLSPWPLSYRNDERNWRLWEAAQARQDT